MQLTRRIALVHRNGEAVLADYPAERLGPTSTLEINATVYCLYWFAVHVADGIDSGIIASPSPPTSETASRALDLLFPQRLRPDSIDH